MFLSRKYKIAWTLCAALLAVPFSPCLAFEVLYEDSPALDAFAFKKKTDLLLRNDAVLVDGAITSNPPGTTFYDRYLLGISRLQSNMVFNNKLALRIGLEAGTLIIRQKEQADPPLDNSGNAYLGRPLVDFTYQTASNLEIVLGAQAKYTSRYTETLETTDFKSTKTFAPVALLVPRAGLYKRLSGFGGGIFYEGKDQKKRTVITTAFDDSQLTADDTVYTPPVIGIAARFKAGPIPTELDFAAVQASEGGPKTSEGERVEEDHVRVRLSGNYPLSQGVEARMVLIHKTLSYADNAVMTLDSIPITTAHMKMIYGKDSLNATLGISYGYGFDVQSLPEFNAKYLLHTYGAHLTVSLQF